MNTGLSNMDKLNVGQYDSLTQISCFYIVVVMVFLG